MQHLRVDEQNPCNSLLALPCDHHHCLVQIRVWDRNVIGRGHRGGPHKGALPVSGGRRPAWLMKAMPSPGRLKIEKRETTWGKHGPNRCRHDQ
ncbi:hypothetical protein P40_17655 [Alloalcanivorax xenomutans]|nr:hypothetical protein P40_17655 [Alloalcanivorax xenomutans]